MEPKGMENPAARFREGLEALAEAGDIEPLGSTLLVRAILRQDAYSLAQGIAYRASDAEAHLVEKVGPLVRGIEPGVFVVCRSVAADRISSDEKCRWWLVDVADVKAVIRPASSR